MIANRSVPRATVIPVLVYPDAAEAADRLARAFAFKVRLRIGERQYTAEDLGGHHWTFSQSVADVDPADWGGVLVEGATG